jgi:hypothetical protein
VSQSLRTVHVRVSDSATGKPIPARIRIAAGAGDYLPPLGRLATLDPNQSPWETEGNLKIDDRLYSYVPKINVAALDFLTGKLDEMSSWVSEQCRIEQTHQLERLRQVLNDARRILTERRKAQAERSAK